MPRQVPVLAPRVGGVIFRRPTLVRQPFGTWALPSQGQSGSRSLYGGMSQGFETPARAHTAASQR